MYCRAFSYAVRAGRRALDEESEEVYHPVMLGRRRKRRDVGGEGA
jgi:hypothetical protein